MGFFHEGDVVSAIAAAKAKGAPLLVFILGDDPSSAEMVRALEDSNDGGGATLRSEAGDEGWVALRLAEGGTDAANFRALCPAGNAPVAVAVDARTGAKIGEASGADGADVLASELKDLREAHESDLRLQTMAALALLSPAAQALLTAYPWPGNVRELENAIERAMVVGNGDTIEADDLPMRAPGEATTPADDRSLAALERVHIERMLDELDGNVTQTAKALGIDRATLYNKLKRYGIRR